MRTTLALLLLASTLRAGPNFIDQTQRPLRYTPDGTDFLITNGPEFFNRPLYGSNTAFRADAGDKPEVSMYLPGRGGNLRIGLRRDSKSKWLHDAEKIVARYRPGMFIYEITDPDLLANASIRVEIVAFHVGEGVIVRAQLDREIENLELVFAFGGANGQRHSRDGDIGTDRIPMSQYFQLSPEYCSDNSFRIDGHRFKMTSRAATITGIAPQGASLGVADANKWNSLSELLDSRGGEHPLLIARSKLNGNSPAYFALQKLSQPEVTPVDDAPAHFSAAGKHFAAIRSKLVVDTPDPFINASVAALNVAADGIWDEPQGVFMHGAVAWRRRLLGWRGAYSGDAIGWHDRARRHLSYWASQQNVEPIPTALPASEKSANLSRNENALHSNGDMSKSHYDMNLVYIDALFRHILWTGDLEFARKVWPVIERHLAWERRLFRRSNGLYEAYAAIWASDDVGYNGGGATHSSAYNYFHNRMAARLARALHLESKAYDDEADAIAGAMRRELWITDTGCFAEWKDLLGEKLVHPSAALWTIYHTIDSQVPTPIEAWQMTRFIDTNHARIPIHGQGVPEEGLFTVPTTNWMPYTWSTNNVVMAEAAHMSLGYWQAGRDDVAFKLLKGCLLDSMFMGLCPGNVGMCTTFDVARGESQRDFADGVGTVSRALVEGLFGIRPDALARELLVQPGFPAHWDRASMRHADFTFDFRRVDERDTYVIEPRFAKAMNVRLRLRAPREGIGELTINGKDAQWKLIEGSVGAPTIEIQSPPSQKHEIDIVWRGKTIEPPRPPTVVVSNDGLGHRTSFAEMRQGQMRWLSPVTVELRPAYQLVGSTDQPRDDVRLRFRNNTAEPIDRDMPIRIGSRITMSRVRAAALSESDEIVLSPQGFLPGTNRISVGDVAGTVTNWKLSIEGRGVKLDTVDLSTHFNDRVTRIFQNEYLSPRSGLCSLAIPKQGYGSWCKPTATYEVDDSGLRASSDRNGGRLLLPQGIPLQTPGAGDAKNIAFVSQWDNYPHEIEMPLSGNASHVYLLMAGSTSSMQSRIDNGEVIVTYADGSSERLALENPTTWWPIDQDYLIDDFAFRRPQPLPIRINLKDGNIRVLEMSSFKGKGGRINGGAATVLDLPLRSDVELKSLKVRALANEVVIGLMSATLARE